MSTTNARVHGKIKKIHHKHVQKIEKKLAEDVAEETVVHSEDPSQSFELMLQEQEKKLREPASFIPSARVIGVHRELAMREEDETKTPQDIILNSGYEKGLVEGMILKVKRKIPVLDPYRENIERELEIEFASVEIIHAENNMSVARVKLTKTADEAPNIGTRSILIGDYVGQ